MTKCRPGRLRLAMALLELLSIDQPKTQALGSLGSLRELNYVLASSWRDYSHRVHRRVFWNSLFARDFQQEVEEIAHSLPSEDLGHALDIVDEGE
jgi:hypothetical protein